MTLKEVIEKLQELNEEDFSITMEVIPLVERYEFVNGEGKEKITYSYNIKLLGKAKIREYTNKCGIIEYKENK